MFSPKYIISTRRRILSFTTIILVIYLIVIIYMPTPAQTHPLSPQDRNAPRRYCSQALFEAIRMICNGRTHSFTNKFPDSFGNRKPSLLRRLLPDDDVIFTPSFSGVAHECCRRPCGYSELHAYCAD